MVKPAVTESFDREITPELHDVRPALPEPDINKYHFVSPRPQISPRKMSEKFTSALLSLVSTATSYRTCIVPENGRKLPETQLTEKDVTAARKALLDAITEFEQVVAEPLDQWEQAAINHCSLSCISWIASFNIPAHVPLHESISYAELAEKAGVPQLQLRRVLRFAMCRGLFTEPKPGMVAHTPYSATFATNRDYAETILLQTRTVAPTLMKLTEMTKTYGESLENTHTAFNIAMTTDDTFYAYQGKNPSVGSRFRSSMRLMAATEEANLRFIADGFDWASLGTATVVDVGGSMGHVSISLAKKFPNLTFSVQDLASVIRNVESQPLPADIADRVSFTAHDFFEPQPASSKQAAAFFFRSIVNNWPTPRAQQILASVAASMKPGAVMVLSNFVVPRPGTGGKRNEQILRARDLFMLAAMNGMERDEELWNELIGGVPGLKIREVKQSADTLQALVVVEKL